MSATVINRQIELESGELAVPKPPGLQLDRGRHIYSFKGIRVPGVTKSLQLAGVIDYSGIPWLRLDRAAEKGKVVHLALEYLDRGTLDRESLDPEIAGHVQAYERFCLDTGFTVGLAERTRYHAQRGYAGTFDRVGAIENSAVVLDFKSGAFLDGHFAQLALYMNFFPRPLRLRGIGLQTFPTGKYQAHEMKASKFEHYSAVGFNAIRLAHQRIQEGRE